MLSANSRNVITPCTGQCRLDKKDVCQGCFRSGTEISEWWNKSEDEKIAIVIRCKKQLEQLRK